MNVNDDPVAVVTALAKGYTRGAGFVTPQPVAAPRGRLGHIGDSLTEQAAENPSTLPGQYLEVSGFAEVAVRGQFGHFIVDAAGDGPSTLDWIREIRASGAEPDPWVIALGTNMMATPEQIQAGDTSADAAAVDQVLAELGPAARVVWVNVGTGWSYPSGFEFHEKVNAMLAHKMRARGANGHVADWWTYCKTRCVDRGLVDAWFQVVPNNDRTHMTALGYLEKHQWLAGEVDAYLTGPAVPPEPPQPTPDMAAVIATASARLAANPEQVRQVTGPFQVDAGFVGWTLAELAVLNRYRRRAL